MTDGALRMRVFKPSSPRLFGGLSPGCGTCKDSRLREELQQRAQTNVLEEVYEDRTRPHPRPQRPTSSSTTRSLRWSRSTAGSSTTSTRPRRDVPATRHRHRRSGRLTKVGDIVDQYGDRSYGPFERVPVAVDVNPELLVFLANAKISFPV